jgi:hypothetical protein
MSRSCHLGGNYSFARTLIGRQDGNDSLSIDSADALPHLRTAGAPGRTLGADVVAGIALLVIALVVGLATAGDYGLTVDEFNTDDYGPKALAWYLSGGGDRSHFTTVEEFLWYYGPWHQILTALAQALKLADPITVRHAMTFLAGIAGLAALIPIARLTVGRWAAPVAIVLCLMTGYLYGSLFFTPIDIPFLAAMNWAVCAILFMARREVPTWRATVAAGLLTGLAIATRTGGIITHAYLVGAMLLCALAVVIRAREAPARPLARIGARTLAAMAIAWITAIALWPWLQIGNPLRQFATAYAHFTHNPMSFEFPHWGELVWTNALPWSYIPEQFLARLPEGFLLLLGLALAFAIASAIRLARATVRRLERRGVAGLAAPALVLARARGTLLVIAAAIIPVGFVMATRATHYDGVRHVMFVIPMLAVLAGGALVRLVPLLRQSPLIAIAAAAIVAAHVGATVLTLVRLHPLEYAAMNALAGGTQAAAGRFEQDYWATSVGAALRQLERRLDHDTSGRFTTAPPRVLVCITHRADIADRQFRRNWTVEVDPDNADFIIDTERWRCGREAGATLIDDVTRLGTTFAWIYANRRGSETRPVVGEQMAPMPIQP